MLLQFGKYSVGKPIPLLSVYTSTIHSAPTLKPPFYFSVFLEVFRSVEIIIFGKNDKGKHSFYTKDADNKSNFRINKFLSPP